MANEEIKDNDEQEGCSPQACSGCASAGSCPSRVKPEDLLEPQNSLSSIKHVIGIVSGKGGVGKSFVTGALAVNLVGQGYSVGILDADITGPSIQKMFGVRGDLGGNDAGIYPLTSRNKIEVMGINMLLDSEDTAVIWRGPVLAGVVKQFWTDVIWGDLDYLLVDMPPGTGDVPLTVYQSIPIDGVVVVTSPQSLVSMIVKKACNMARQMNIPILGIVENYSYVVCPDCGRHINVFGESSIDELAAELGLPVLGKIPVNPDWAKMADYGRFDKVDASVISAAADKIKEICC